MDIIEMIWSTGAFSACSKMAKLSCSVFALPSYEGYCRTVPSPQSRYHNVAMRPQLPPRVVRHTQLRHLLLQELA